MDLDEARRHSSGSISPSVCARTSRESSGLADAPVHALIATAGPSDRGKRARLRPIRDATPSPPSTHPTRSARTPAVGRRQKSGVRGADARLYAAAQASDGYDPGQSTSGANVGAQLISRPRRRRPARSQLGESDSTASRRSRWIGTIAMSRGCRNIGAVWPV
jgi:hypothetical protein